MRGGRELCRGFGQELNLPKLTQADHWLTLDVGFNVLPNVGAVNAYQSHLLVMVNDAATEALDGLRTALEAAVVESEVVFVAGREIVVSRLDRLNHGFRQRSLD
ncbi:MAG: hypothetical protein ACYCW6_21480 [Candidatus Xenobia bacterium]